MWGRKDEQTPSQPATPAARSETAPARPVTRPASAPSPPPAARGQAMIGKSLRIKGTITGTEDLYVDGEVEGTIRLEQNGLTVGPNGKVDAEIEANDITIEGKVTGNVKAGDRIDIRKTGSLHGDLSTARIVIEDGAVFRGSIDIVKPEPVIESKPAPLAPAPAPALKPEPKPAAAVTSEK